MDVGQVGFHSDKEVPIILYSIVTEIFTFVGEDNKSGEEGKRGGKQVEQDPAGENTWFTPRKGTQRSWGKGAAETTS